MTKSGVAFKVAAAFGFFAVALGAFGSHGLKDILLQNGMTETWKTASLYHLAHSVLLLWLAWAGINQRAFWSFVVGIFIFSGSLYLMSVTGIRWLGAVTPVGGLALLSGWLFLFFQKKSVK
jgi:uncharacterized membrane protein YgdD (TMEM256/DUF423 family)